MPTLTTNNLVAIELTTRQLIRVQSVYGYAGPTTSIIRSRRAVSYGNQIVTWNVELRLRECPSPVVLMIAYGKCEPGRITTCMHPQVRQTEEQHLGLGLCKYDIIFPPRVKLPRDRIVRIKVFPQ